MPYGYHLTAHLLGLLFFLNCQYKQQQQSLPHSVFHSSPASNSQLLQIPEGGEYAWKCLSKYTVKIWVGQTQILGVILFVQKLLKWQLQVKRLFTEAASEISALCSDN